MLEAPHHVAGDQAAGLRRLFGERPTRVISFVSGREACGRTTLLVQTATALAQAGQGVVIIDENSGPNNVFAAFGMTPRHDLIDLAQGACSAQQLMQPVAPLVRAVGACRLAAARLDRNDICAAYLDAGLRQIQRAAAFVLIDCAASRGGQLSALALAATHVAVVVAAQGPSITSAYALIKRLARERRRDNFQVVVTRARSGDEARAIFENLGRTAREHLGVRLDYLGGPLVPARDHLAEALQSRLPLAAADGGGFLPFEPYRGARRSGAGHGPTLLESVV